MTQDIIAYVLVGLAAVFLLGKALGFWSSSKACCKKHDCGAKVK